MRLRSKQGLARSSFPAECRYSYEQVMNPDFWPE
jgi:hypothetical protein